jgi:hypothetical protein
MKLSWLLFAGFALAAAAATSSFAGDGHSSGNGGNGIVAQDGKRVFLFDLVEAGVEEKPYFGCRGCGDPRFASRVKLALGSTTAATDLVVGKLKEIADVDLLSAMVLLRAMEMYSWRWVNTSLSPIVDYDGTDLDIQADRLLQLAVRDQKIVRIDAGLWSRMPDDHKAALIFHEVIYALVGSDSRAARELTSFFFTEDLKRGHYYLEQVVRDVIPAFASEKAFGFVVEASSSNVFSIFPDGQTYSENGYFYFDSRTTTADFAAVAPKACKAAFQRPPSVPLPETVDLGVIAGGSRCRINFAEDKNPRGTILRLRAQCGGYNEGTSLTLSARTTEAACVDNALKLYQRFYAERLGTELK